MYLVRFMKIVVGFLLLFLLVKLNCFLFLLRINTSKFYTTTISLVGVREHGRAICEENMERFRCEVAVFLIFTYPIWALEEVSEFHLELGFLESCEWKKRRRKLKEFRKIIVVFKLKRLQKVSQNLNFKKQTKKCLKFQNFFKNS